MKKKIYNYLQEQKSATFGQIADLLLDEDMSLETLIKAASTCLTELVNDGRIFEVEESYLDEFDDFATKKYYTTK